MNVPFNQCFVETLRLQDPQSYRLYDQTVRVFRIENNDQDDVMEPRTARFPQVSMRLRTPAPPGDFIYFARTWMLATEVHEDLVSDTAEKQN